MIILELNYELFDYIHMNDFTYGRYDGRQNNCKHAPNYYINENTDKDVRGLESVKIKNSQFKATRDII